MRKFDSHRLAERLRRQEGNRDCPGTKAQAAAGPCESEAEDVLSQVDAEAWIAVLREHRLRIAETTGLYPSSVKIEIGRC